MKAITPAEIEAATFKINPSVKLSGANEDKLILAARRVISGFSVEQVAQDVFNSSSDWIISKVLEKVELMQNGKELQFIQHHREKAADTTETRFKRVNVT
jgi:hypothetical protein